MRCAGLATTTQWHNFRFLHLRWDLAWRFVFLVPPLASVQLSLYRCILGLFGGWPINKDLCHFDEISQGYKHHCLKNVFKKMNISFGSQTQHRTSTFLKRAPHPPPHPKTALGLHYLQFQTQAQELDFCFLQAKSLTFWKIVSLERNKIKRQTHQWSHSVLFPSKQKGQTSLCVSVNVNCSQPGPTRRDADTHQCFILCWAYRPLPPGEGAQHDFGTRSKLHAHMFVFLFCFFLIFVFFFVQRNRYRKKRNWARYVC